MPSVTRKPRQGRERRRAELRDRLRAAAEARLAAGENLAHVPADRLAELAGFSRSTFYGYFDDKGDLLRAWLLDITARIDMTWTADTKPTRAELRERVAAVVDAYADHAPIMAAIHDAAAYEPALAEEVAAFVAQNVRLVKRHIALGQAEGWIAANVPADTAAWLVWMIERGLHQGVDQAAEGLADVLWLTLYAHA